MFLVARKQERLIRFSEKKLILTQSRLTSSEYRLMLLPPLTTRSAALKIQSIQNKRWRHEHLVQPRRDFVLVDLGAKSCCGPFAAITELDPRRRIILRCLRVAEHFRIRSRGPMQVIFFFWSFAKDFSRHKRLLNRNSFWVWKGGVCYDSDGLGSFVNSGTAISIWC